MAHHEHLPVSTQLKDLIIESDKTLGLVVKKTLDFTRAIPLELLASASFEEIAGFANQLQKNIAQTVGVDESKLRLVSPENIELFECFVTANPNTVAFMRHGEQNSNVSKLEKMQQEHNIKDPLTAKSMAEAAGTAFVLWVLQERTGIPITIKTSGNVRSAQVGAVIAKVTGSRLIYDKWLNCVNYRDDIPLEALNELLGRENNGALIWEQKRADTVCSEGEGTFQRVTEETAEVLAEGLNSQVLTLLVTHTQQTNALDKQMGEDPTRYDELGVRLVGKESSQLIKSGFY